MIFFLAPPGARLGNELFQLAALDKLCNGRQIGVFFESTPLSRHFHWRRRGVFISSRGRKRAFRLLRNLSRHGLASYRTEELFETEFGLVPSGELLAHNSSYLPFTIVEDAFLQSDLWLRDDFQRMLLFKESTTKSVHEFATLNGIDWETAIFVHVRRGDYNDWNILNAGSPTLPAAYYRKGVQRLQSKMPVSVVVFVTDDAAWVHREFAEIPQKLVVSQSAIFDLCVMSKCASGVMSASSFSWWGAMLGPQRVAPVAPQYWLGWKRRILYPASIISTRFDPLTVECEPSASLV
jgi:hypothetical protein